MLYFWCVCSPPKQCVVFFLSYEQSSEDNYANSWVFKIGLMLLAVVFTIFHKTRIIRELSVKIMNRHIYGKHMSMMWIMLLFWVWIFSVHREGFRSCDKTTDVRLATLTVSKRIHPKIPVSQLVRTYWISCPGPIPCFFQAGLCLQFALLWILCRPGVCAPALASRASLK